MEETYTVEIRIQGHTIQLAINNLYTLSKTKSDRNKWVNSIMSLSWWVLSYKGLGNLLVQGCLEGLEAKLMTIITYRKIHQQQLVRTCKDLEAGKLGQAWLVEVVLGSAKWHQKASILILWCLLILLPSIQISVSLISLYLVFNESL